MMKKISFWLVMSAFVFAFGCSTVKTNTPGDSLAANRGPASNAGAVTFIFDDSVTEPRVMAVYAVKGTSETIYTCLKSKIISDVLQSGTDPKEYVEKYCKSELQIRDEKDLADVLAKAESFLAKTKDLRAKKRTLGTIAIIGSAAGGIGGGVLLANTVTKWADRVAAQYLAHSSTDFFHSSFDFFSALMSMGENSYRYTYFKSKEAQLAYERVYRRASFYKGAGGVVLAAAAIGGIVYGSQERINVADLPEERAAVKAVAVTVESLFEKGSSNEKTGNMGLASVFAGLRKVGYPTWGQIQ